MNLGACSDSGTLEENINNLLCEEAGGKEGLPCVIRRKRRGLDKPGTMCFLGLFVTISGPPPPSSISPPQRQRLASLTAAVRRNNIYVGSSPKYVG
ncbi:hypothetical protein J6590_007470 [Homalodisca vitripennis]|nr:hypothetical protein J6590_007470 [Homalodisca vitripennis]